MWRRLTHPVPRLGALLTLSRKTAQCSDDENNSPRRYSQPPTPGPSQGYRYSGLPTPGPSQHYSQPPTPGPSQHYSQLPTPGPSQHYSQLPTPDATQQHRISQLSAPVATQDHDSPVNGGADAEGVVPAKRRRKNVEPRRFPNAADQAAAAGQRPQDQPPAEDDQSVVVVTDVEYELYKQQVDDFYKGLGVVDEELGTHAAGHSTYLVTAPRCGWEREKFWDALVAAILKETKQKVVQGLVARERHRLALGENPAGGAQAQYLEMRHLHGVVGGLRSLYLQSGRRTNAAN